MAQPTPEGESQSPSPGPFPPKEQWRYWIWFLVLGMLFGYFLWMGEGGAGRTADLSYTQFKQEVRAGTVAEVTVRGQEITGAFRPGQAPATQEPAEGGTPPSRFRTHMPTFEDPKLMDLLEANGVEVSAVPQGESWLGPLLLGLLPLLFLMALI
ncbi:MAG TPA: ATP-dependent metallopeptidase FtsH/Yme1/Tma family protein, partial [Gammaproteobacteria bacterium]|nr:ATP-dependent metallopeptidase FtsH/Yme1/Tma family protein [Gammaproteobacteria bacterium]